MDRDHKRIDNVDRNMNAGIGSIKAFAIVYDRHGRIVLDKEVFQDKEKLEKLRQEVLKNGSYTSGNSNP